MVLSKPYLGIHTVISKIKYISRRKKKCQCPWQSSTLHSLLSSILCIQRQNQCCVNWKFLAVTRMACGKYQIVAYLPLFSFPEILGRNCYSGPKITIYTCTLFVSKCYLKSNFSVFQIWNSFLQPDSLEQCPLLWKYCHVGICLLSEIPRIILLWVFL